MTIFMAGIVGPWINERGRGSMEPTPTAAIQTNQDLRCPKCQIAGAATWEETPSAVPRARARNRLRKLVGLTAGFKSVDTGECAGPAIACGGCGARIAG
jgi:hypothetical protein